MARKRPSPKVRDGGKDASASVPKILASWQRALLWGTWAGVVAVLWQNTHNTAMGFREFCALAAGIAITVWTCKHPKGIKKVIIEVPSEMRGRFESRTNWPVVLLAAFCSLVGLSMCIILTRDSRNGLTSFGGVLEDFAMVFVISLEIALSGGTSGDVTDTKLYILIFMLPIGLLWVFLALVPWMFRGMPFRVEPGGLVEVRRDGRWQLLHAEEFPVVVADGINVEFRESRNGAAVIRLPQGRVYCAELGTPVKETVIATFFKEWLEKRGFTIEPWEPGASMHRKWVARRTGSGGETLPPSD